MSAQPILPKQRIGVFGGAFDPPHQAHVALAKAALEQLALDLLYLIPTGQAWHKNRPLSAPSHRLAMARLAFEDLPRVRVDDCEVQRPGPTFTIDTLHSLQARHPQAQLYVLMGADQFAAFRQWHRWPEILEIAIICIAERPDSMRATSEIDSYSVDGHQFVILHVPLMPVSSTQIRQLIASNSATVQNLTDWVGEPVARYISVHELYSRP